MPILGERPESGVRVAIERPTAGGPPWRYAGAAHAPHASFPIEATLTAEGEATVEVQPAADGTPAPPEMAERVRLLLRTAHRQAKADGQAPARRIVRWRAASDEK